MRNCSYTSNIVVVLMRMLMMFYNLVCLSDRTTDVNCSIIIIKPTQTLYTLLGYISPIYLTHVAATVLPTIKETA